MLSADVDQSYPEELRKARISFFLLSVSVLTA